MLDGAWDVLLGFGGLVETPADIGNQNTLVATILIKNEQFQIVEQLRSDYLDSAAEVVERLAALPEWEMRVTSLVEHLEEVGNLQAVWTLESVVRGALQH